MYLPQVEVNQNKANYISQFLGLNLNPVLGDGEFSDMENLSSDNFPLLSPRKKRNLALNIGKSTWDSKTLTWTETAEVDVSKAVGTYTSSTLTITGRDTYKLNFEYDDDVISHVKVFLKENNKVTTEQTFMDPTCELIFVTDTATTSLSVEIVAYAISPEDFDPDDMTNYITNRTLKVQIAVIRGILCKDNKLAYMLGQKMYYGTTEVNFSTYFPEDDDKVSDLQLISFGVFILVFPTGLWFNTKDGSYGKLGAYIKVEGANVSYSICNSEGTAYNPTVSATAPANPQDGDYWLNTTEQGLYIWYNSMSTWQPIATSYIKIEVTGADFDSFEVGDAVFMNTKLADINEGSIIRAVSGNAIIVEGFMEAATDSETIDFECERRIPQLDFVCVAQNRVWGCYAGKISGSDVVNEIYCTKQGDPTNWYVYDGISTDSYALSLGDDGDFTGAVTFQGYPMFFKENVVYKIYGSYPAAYQLVTYDCRGVQKGSEKSLCVLGELLIYKSIKDFCVWDGSTPSRISDNLGDNIFTNAVAGVALNKYYVSMKKGDESWFMVYDITKGLWHMEDSLDIEQFTYNNQGQLYGKNGLNIYGFGLASDDFGLTNQEEMHVHWSATLSKQYAQRSTQYHTYTSVEKVKPSKVIIRADVPYNSELTVYVSYDDKPFENVIEIRGNENSHEFAFTPVRCDHYQIKLEGRDDCKVYLIQTEFQQGSVK